MPNETEQVQCPYCGALHTKPPGNLHNYRCVRCGYSPLVPILDYSNQQTGLAIAGALIGAGLVGVPGAIAGALIGYLAGSKKQ